MAYLYVRHRGKHLLPVGVLVLCNKVEHFSCSAPAGLAGRIAGVDGAGPSGRAPMRRTGLCGRRPSTRRAVV